MSGLSRGAVTLTVTVMILPAMLGRDKQSEVHISAYLHLSAYLDISVMIVSGHWITEVQRLDYAKSSYWITEVQLLDYAKSSYWMSEAK